MLVTFSSIGKFPPHLYLLLLLPQLLPLQLQHPTILPPLPQLLPPRKGNDTQTKLGKALSRMASRRNGVRDQASHSRKRQTARPHIVHWRLSHHRPIRVRLHCQARCRRQCSLYGLNLQLDNRCRSSYSFPPLDCFKRWQSDHTCHHPHRLSELSTERKKWNGKTKLECVDGRHPTSKTPVGVLPSTYRSEGRWSCR